MQKLVVEETIKRERFSDRFIALLVFLVAVFAITRVILANRLIESSDKLSKLDSQITELSAQNELLSAEIRDRQSLSLIFSQAQTAGFVPTSQISFLKTPSDVALETNSLSQALR